MAIAEKIFAALGLLLCLVFLLRLVLAPRHRRQLDSRARQGWATLRQGVRGAGKRRKHHQQASTEAEAAIRRAREGISRDGNMIRPKSFKRPRKPH